MEDIENFLKEIGVGRRPANDPFFEETYKSCKVFEKMGVTIEDEEELCHEVMDEFTCNACHATFKNLLDYELHYHDFHHFICAECKKSRPTPRLLEIHIQEAHDSFFKVLAEKQSMYQCFVSECDIKFKNPVERREHCREIHAFPKNYRFDESTHEKAKKISEKNTSMDVDENSESKKKDENSASKRKDETSASKKKDENSASKKKDSKIYLDKNTKRKTFSKQNFSIKPSTESTINDSKPDKKMSPVTMFIPRQVYQKSYAKVLTKNQEMEKNVLESESIMELGESLPST